MRYILAFLEMTGKLFTCQGRQMSLKVADFPQYNLKTLTTSGVDNSKIT